MMFMSTGIETRELGMGGKTAKFDVFNQISKTIPNGFNEGDGCYALDFHSASGDKELDNAVNEKLGKQYGTLGSGNHFIEIGIDLASHVCITIHSGSRRPGWLIGNHYMKLARLEGEYKKFFKLDSELGKAYLHDMNFALNYALANRLEMMTKVCKILEVPLAKGGVINENHNHAAVCDAGILHRKGATPAEKGQLGVIPGSMKTGVYVTEGLGNWEFLNSASHGAGRKMSRKAAKNKISLEKFASQMEGIIANVSDATLDEAPDAYKDLNYVINAQEGIVVKLVNFVDPIINVKG
jgi:tRNA-splicing ligase RtcB